MKVALIGAPIEAGADRAGDVRDGGVPLQVDELSGCVGDRSPRYPPQHERLGHLDHLGHLGKNVGRCGRDPGPGERFSRCPLAIGQAPGEGEDTIGGSGDGQPVGLLVG